MPDRVTKLKQMFNHDGSEVKPPNSSLEGSEQFRESYFEQVQVLNSVQLRQAVVTAQHYNYREISVTSQT